MTAEEKHARRQRFDYKQYRKLALIIHRRFCDSPDWCNYGEPLPEELEDDKSPPWAARQERARKRLEWYRHCQAAVDAENIAARVMFGKGGKVRR